MRSSRCEVIGAAAQLSSTYSAAVYALQGKVKGLGERYLTHLISLSETLGEIICKMDFLNF